MPEKQEANAHSQPNEGLRHLQERRQVRDGAGGRGGWWDTGTAGGETASPECLRLGHSHATVPGVSVGQGRLWDGRGPQRPAPTPQRQRAVRSRVQPGCSGQELP